MLLNLFNIPSLSGIYLGREQLLKNINECYTNLEIKFGKVSANLTRSSLGVRWYTDGVITVAATSSVHLPGMNIYAALSCETMDRGQGKEVKESIKMNAPKTSSHHIRNYLAPHVCVVEGSQHIWTQNFITSSFQKHLGTRFIFSLFMQRAVKHKRDLRTWLYIPITSEWRDVGRHTLCAHIYVWVKTPNILQCQAEGLQHLQLTIHHPCEWGMNGIGNALEEKGHHWSRKIRQGVLFSFLPWICFFVFGFATQF